MGMTLKRWSAEGCGTWRNWAYRGKKQLRLRVNRERDGWAWRVLEPDALSPYGRRTQTSRVIATQEALCETDEEAKRQAEAAAKQILERT